jgi:leucyl-tRNA synthetase
MEGKRALFPQGYHCTGMPIKACADKLAREIEMFGKGFEGYDEAAELAADAAAAALKDPQAKTDLGKFGGSKSKANAKTIQTKYQFQVFIST